MKKYIITIAFLVISVALMVFGISQNQYGEVLVKAVNVCLECIGIG